MKVFFALLGFLVLGLLVTPVANATSDNVWNAIVQCESGGNPRAQNPHSSASGLFQDLDSTWHHFDGYPRAMDAPPSVQWTFNTRLAISNWDASRSCWGPKVGSVAVRNFRVAVPAPAPRTHYSKPKYHPATPDIKVSPSPVQLTSAGGGYTVVTGDTVSGIASAHSEDWRSLYAKNTAVIGSNPNLIYPGQYFQL